VTPDRQKQTQSDEEMAEELQGDAVIYEYRKQEMSQFDGFTKS
jgi:hypothetical protein